MMETRWKRILAIVLTVTLFVTMTGVLTCIITGDRVYAAESGNIPNVCEQAAYQEASWTNGVVTYSNKTADNCTPVTDSTEAVTWDESWYVVNGIVTIDQPITVNGDVNLILVDGCTLNAKQGIVVTENNSLTIYAQVGGTGTLNATGVYDTSGMIYDGASAGIGGSVGNPNSGAVTIHGGVINATGGNNGYVYSGVSAAGIGGGISLSGNGGSSGTIIIYGGTITADSGQANATGAGIGGGNGSTRGGTGSNITIYGGNVTATSSGGTSSGAGIGGGSGNTSGGEGSNITISGGEVTAIGGQYAAGIGGGGGYSSNTTGGTGTGISITGGIVDAKGGGGNAIGNGRNASGTADITKTAGIIFENGEGKVHGTVALDGEYTVPAGYTLTFAEGGQFDGNYAFYKDGTPIEMAVVKANGVTGPVTVAECKHDASVCEYQLLDDGASHKKTCLACGMAWEEEPHTLGEGNKCEGCNAELKVQVQIGSATTYYGTFDNAWDVVCNENENAVKITLLADATSNYLMEVSEGQDFTFSGGEHTLTMIVYFNVEGGSLTITDGTFIGEKGALFVGSGTVHLSGGKFIADSPYNPSAIDCVSDVSSLLLNYGSTNAADKHYAYFDEAGRPIVLEEGQKSLPGPVTVGVCEHPGVKDSPNNDGTHSLKCPYCGYTGTAANCTYGTEYQHDDTYHWLTCTACGYKKERGHDWELKVENTDNVTKLSQGCSTCKFEKYLFTVTIIVPDGLIYGQTGNKQLTCTFDTPKTYDHIEWKLTSGQLSFECESDGTLPADLPVGEYQLSAEGKTETGAPVFYGYAKVTVAPAPLTGDMVTLSPESVTYSGTEQKPAIAVKQGETTLTAGTDYDVTYSTTDFTNAGTITVTITGKGNYTGTVETTYTIQKAPLTITASNQTITYGGSITQGTDDVTAAGLCSGDRLDGITLTASTANVPGGNITPSAAGIKNSGGKDVTGNYEITYKDGRLTINKADAEITVGTDAYNKTFGDAAFTLDVTDNNTEADVQYEVTEGTDVVSVSNETVTIQNAGTATITVSLPASTNYNAAASRTITVSVAPKGGYTVAEMNRSYLYSRGNTGSIDLAALLPKDCGTAAYGTPEASGNVTYSAAPAVSNGKLSYTLNSGNINDEGIITVTVATQNYTDITITVKVKLTDQIPVSLKTGTEVTLKDNVLTYGETLSKLIFNEAEFVGDDGNTVAGTLAWKEAAATPNAGTASAVWVFTPADTAYVEVEGTAAITVNKAAPTVSETPVVADRVYNPSRVLEQGDLSGITVTGMDGNTLKGEWSWKSANIIPTVNNSGYVAVFTPTDATNYETVTSTITVNVTKAIPYIAELPTAAGITYGDTLNVSALSGGTVQYGNGTGQAGSGAGSTETVAGIFTWKESSTRPAVADSGKTEYTVVFTPSDTINYETTECSVTLTVQKAVNAPNMPGSTMDVPNSCERVSDVALPENWEWKTSDQDPVLEVGKAVNAVAVYTGADKGSYEKETVTITITRASCDHVAGEILYTGEGEKASACESDGLGHRECTKCGSVIETGIVIPALKHNYTDKVTKEPTTESEGIRTYTCNHCGDTYTKSIPKLPRTASGNTSNQENKIPVKGEVISDAKSKAVYTVTQAGKTGGTVSYTKSADNKATSISVPNTVVLNGISYKVTAIAQNAFKNNKKLTKVTIGNNITAIGNNAFYGCKKLKNVSMGTNVTTIGTKSFYKCTSLTKITISAKVSRIGKQAFYGCKKLKTITIKTKKLTSKKVGSKAFKGIHSKATVKVPKSKLKIYKQMLKAKGIGSKVKVKK